MKKILSVLLVLFSLWSLCACGGKEESQPTPAEPAPVETAVPVEENTPVTQEPVTPEPPLAVPSAYEAARELEGENIRELLSAIGEPVSREDYAPSCLGDGEDGIWHYEGFDVYTYREGENESVYAVMKG